MNWTEMKWTYLVEVNWNELNWIELNWTESHFSYNEEVKLGTELNWTELKLLVMNWNELKISWGEQVLTPKEEKLILRMFLVLRRLFYTLQLNVIGNLSWIGFQQVTLKKQPLKRLLHIFHIYWCCLFISKSAFSVSWSIFLIFQLQNPEGYTTAWNLLKVCLLCIILCPILN